MSEFAQFRIDIEFLVLDCKPIQMWIINRHGTRFPVKRDVENMKKGPLIRDEIIANYEIANVSIEDSLCLEDYAILKDWQYDDVIEAKPKYLNEQGWKDLLEIAQRLKKRYPELFGGEYKEQDFSFRHSFTQRAHESCKAFIDGLFGEGANANVTIEKPLKEDPVTYVSILLLLSFIV
jgi:multiple inositol-polyphosphate phosphatase / 2,3-bisphosphoglycerate 3-phosphatase